MRDGAHSRRGRGVDSHILTTLGQTVRMVIWDSVSELHGVAAVRVQICQPLRCPRSPSLRRASIRVNIHCMRSSTPRSRHWLQLQFAIEARTFHHPPSRRQNRITFPPVERPISAYKVRQNSHIESFCTRVDPFPADREEVVYFIIRHVDLRDKAKENDQAIS